MVGQQWLLWLRVAFLTLFQVHVAVLVKVVAAHGAVELVVGIHLLGGVGYRCGR
jgi:hypothetical protein